MISPRSICPKETTQSYPTTLFSLPTPTLFKTFEFGSGLTKDTADFYNGAIQIFFYNAGSDTLVATSPVRVLWPKGAGGISRRSGKLAQQLKSGSATNLNASAYTVTSLTTGDEDVAFVNAKIPPANFVWATLSGITSGNKPSYLGVNLSGYRIPGIASTIPGDTCTYTQNLVKYSEQLDNSSWFKSSGLSVTSINADYDLDGNATLEEITVTDGTSHIRNHPGEGNLSSVIPGETYRFSFDVKKRDTDRVKIQRERWHSFK